MTNHLDLTRLRALPTRLRGRVTRRLRGRDEAGYVTVVISILIPALFIGLAATAVDTSRWYLEGERVQKAADAAALAGVPFLPQDMASARTRALEVARRNGYDDADPNVSVTVTQGDRSTQLRVTISSTITNQFGQIIGVDSTGITRTAVADFTGPAPMGSPCNTFGTEPPAGAGAVSPAPTGSAIGSVRPGNCPQNPMMWATVEGPDTPKREGDRYSTESCYGGEDLCSGAANSEYPEGSDKKGERGYFWVIKVQPSMVNRPIQLQLYDPAFVLTGVLCGNNTSASTDQLPDRSTLADNMNPFVTTDGRDRYPNVDTVPPGQEPAVPFCTGDNYPGYNPPATNPPTPNLTTTFLVREQTDTMDPTQAPVITGCAKQYGAFTRFPTYDDLKSTRPTYNSQLAQVFHNWTSLCTFTPTRSGDYYLQVRTNKSHVFGAGELVRTVPPGELGAVSAKNGDASPTGYGTNGFAIRAVTPAGLERGVAVSGWDRMPIYANSKAATSTFNLIRVLPGAAGQYIDFSFFDVGDAVGSGSATVKVLLPTDAVSSGGGSLTTPFPGGCTSKGGAAGAGQTLLSCTATGISSSTNNGKTQRMLIPIPPDYSCNPTVFTNCWYRVQVSFSSGAVNDVTTWDAQIAGDPVRLIE
jgi:Flp pilus assembly protein TadG